MFSYFFLKLILKKSADENKSVIKYPGCNELTPYQLITSAADIQVYFRLDFYHDRGSNHYGPGSD